MSSVRLPESGARAIPGILTRFLERASVALGCTRGPDLTPRIHWVSGWGIDPEPRSIWGFVPKAFEAGLRETVVERGPFALTVEHIGPHECYQFKGRLLELRPSTDADRAVVARCRDRFSAAVRVLLPHLAHQEAALSRYILDPAVAVRFEVKEIYLQTPGPGAGSLLATLEGGP